MSRTARLLIVVVLTAVACTAGDNPAPRASESRLPSLAFGGTLRAAFPLNLAATFDPQKAYDGAAFEVFRCCLLRTLLSYNGRPTDQGGAELHPDLATSMPDVSSDGLTWTFRLKSGLHYAPPFQAAEIVAGDLVRAIEREASIHAPYPFYYDDIQGFAAYSSGATDSISGLQTPDDHTLVVQLAKPSGDLGYRLALPAAAPIPPGAVNGHSDYGRYLVASGPYMFEGSQNLDFSKPAADQVPASGYVPYRLSNESFTQGSMTLVRNPSWDPSTDQLRAAYVDRIELSFGGFDTEHFSSTTDYRTHMKALFDQVSQGGLDLVLDTSPSIAQLGSLRSTELGDLLHENEASSPVYIQLNLAVPPLDDIHVRKAIALVIDKTTLQRRWFASVSGKPVPESTGTGVLSTHIAPEALEGGLLLNYRPSWMTSLAGGDIAAARAQMALSEYDRNGNGTCDAAACKHVRLVQSSLWPRAFDPSVVRDLAKIGIQVRVKSYVPNRFYSTHGPSSPAARAAMTTNSWLNDYPNGSAFFPPFFYGPNLRSTHIRSVFDFSMLGATPAELRRWGYSVEHVPSVDNRIQECNVLIGKAQEECWATLDQYLMEKVIPMIPFMFETAIRLVSPRVAQYSFDQAIGMPALDQIALEAGST